MINREVLLRAWRIIKRPFLVAVILTAFLTIATFNLEESLSESISVGVPMAVFAILVIRNWKKGEQ